MTWQNLKLEERDLRRARLKGDSAAMAGHEAAINALKARLDIIHKQQEEHCMFPPETALNQR